MSAIMTYNPKYIQENIKKNLVVIENLCVASWFIGCIDVTCK
jgi:hypothetical protein